MATSATIDDEAWAQTLVTVTPQEDGFLREIHENSVISGAPKEQLHLDTWNIVSRRPLMNSNNFINPKDLEKSERISSDTQTYLQGVPRVELPLVYRDEATQTLYIGRDGPKVDTMGVFDHIITVMNEKPLPEWKKTQIVQTNITFDSEISHDLLVKQLETDTNIEKTIEESNEKNTFIEVGDVLNFMMERTFWMSEPIAVPERETKDAEIETLIKYNHNTKKLTFDHETQTQLTCEPRHSNSMLLSEYNEAKCICKKGIEECMEKGVYPRMVVDSMIEEIVEKCRRQIDFPVIEKDDTDCEKIIRSVNKRSPLIYKEPRKQPLDLKSRRTENILLADNPAYVVRTRSTAEEDPFLRPGCSSNTEKATIIPVGRSNISSESSQEFSYSSSSQESSYSSGTQKISYSPRVEKVLPNCKRCLNSRDKEALDVLKNTFCRWETCPNRMKSSNLIESDKKETEPADEPIRWRLTRYDNSGHSPGWINYPGIKSDYTERKAPEIASSSHQTDETLKDPLES